MSKRRRALTKLARRYGRRVVYTNAGHYRLVCKRGERPFVACSSTPTNVDHWLRSVERDLKALDDPKRIL